MDWESCTLFKKNLKRFMTYLDSFKQSIEHNKKGIIYLDSGDYVEIKG